MEKTSTEIAEHSQRPYHYTPYIDINLQFDPLQADPLLQKSLVFEDSDDDSDSRVDHLEADGTFTDTENEYRYHGFSMTKASSYQHKRKLSPAEVFPDSISDISGRFDDADEDVLQEQTAEDTTSVHSAKRGRSNGWPVQNEIAYDENGMKIDLSARRSTPTLGKNKHTPVLRIRRSRFIEGSMNDRVSEKPPSIFFLDDRQTHADVGQTENRKSLEKRSSGIFRFGKAIASAFHPFGGSKGNKSEQDAAAKSQKEIMKQRQAKAEKAYAELKKSGYRGTNTTFSTKNQVDAGVADETWKSIQEKMGYKLANESRISQDDTLVGISPDGLGPISPERGVLKLKSFSELRKRTSNLSIPAIRFRDVSPMSMRASIERNDDRDHQQMERRQSRRELHKQAKLLKRVSNLEDKLERARRELREYVPDDNQPPIPTICVDDEHDRQFRQGLPTLLSERVLEAGYVQPGTSQRVTKWPPIDSLSRKRKSPIPMPTGTIDLEENYTADCGNPLPDGDDDDEEEGDKSNEKRLRNKLKSGRDKRASSLTTKASQRLKAKQSSRNLRADAVASKEEEGKHLQEQEGNISAQKKKKNKGWTCSSGDGYENIPPVPPVPKELLDSTKSGVSPKKLTSTMKARIPSKEFAWPEDIF
ncbi:nuclear RNA binding protein, putative [Talaromyces stipitatus ATCC 10500]|uniref:Nuclear RNA binding protein, putative n=1 Tax=Talaromyces stipitatus (strain ATCC 10500 / CBS 375.48 / QM 6759 / NRRL 1006) TaxID=441959 RepID=B8M2H6_TALSN|nr:nuclear RNA binding protein, putative [Talaromyces stipitatus ATCC 10500]EED21640.1 nuclear RNA binding protein, putative [Talaromyces stipitatus ATCC 10500]